MYVKESNAHKHTNHSPPYLYANYKNRPDVVIRLNQHMFYQAFLAYIVSNIWKISKEQMQLDTTEKLVTEERRKRERERGKKEVERKRHEDRKKERESE